MGAGVRIPAGSPPKNTKKQLSCAFFLMAQSARAWVSKIFMKADEQRGNNAERTFCAINMKACLHREGGEKNTPAIMASPDSWKLKLK